MVAGWDPEKGQICKYLPHLGHQPLVLGLGQARQIGGGRRVSDGLKIVVVVVVVLGRGELLVRHEEQAGVGGRAGKRVSERVGRSAGRSAGG